MKKSHQLLMAFLFIICFSIPIMSVEERPHQVIKKEGNIEIRLYKDIMSAEVTTTGSRDDAASNAFRLLFKYIKGENENNQKINMTSPVAQTKNKSQEWVVSFFMPSNMTPNSTPKATNPQIKIKTNKQVKVAAIRFSGSGKQKNLDQHTKELIEYLEKNKIVFKNTPTYAFYNPPFIPWFLRRNEVLFEIE